MFSGVGVRNPSQFECELMSCLVDYKAKDYRAFVFVLHEDYGILLLRCTRKPNKPDHWQVPGGHIDEAEFQHAASQAPDRVGQLLHASKSGAARELWEETGIDVRHELDRLLPPFLHDPSEAAMPNEYENRIYYFLMVTDADFGNDDATTATRALNVADDAAFQHVKLKISHEHSGFTFEPDMKKAAEDIVVHSGGKNSKVLRMAMKLDESS